MEAFKHQEAFNSICNENMDIPAFTKTNRSDKSLFEKEWFHQGGVHIFTFMCAQAAWYSRRPASGTRQPSGTPLKNTFKLVRKFTKLVQ